MPDTSAYRFLVNTGVTAVASVFNFIMGFLVLTAAKNILGNTGLGVWSLALGLAAMAALVDFGFGSALGILVARYAGSNEKNHLHQILNAFVVTAFPLALGITVIGVLIAPVLARLFVHDAVWHAQASLLFAMMFVMIGLQVSGSLIGGILVGYQKLGIFRIWHSVWKMLQSIGVLWMLYRGVNLGGIGLWMVLNTAGFIITTWVIWLRYVPVRFNFSLPAKAAVHELWRTAIPMQLNRIAGAMLGQVDKFVLALLIGAIFSGWYELAAKLAGALLFLPGFMLAALAPIVSAMVGEQAHGRAISLLRLVSRYVNLVVFPLAGFIWLYTEPLLQWWLGHADAHIMAATRILLLMYLLLAIQQPYVDVLLGMGRNRVVARFGIVVIVMNIPTSFLLVDVYGFPGSYWASLMVVCLASVSFFSVVLSELMIPLRVWINDWIRPLLATALTVMIMHLLPMTPQAFLSTAACMAVGGTIYAVCAWFLGGFNHEDILRFRKVWRER